MKKLMTLCLLMMLSAGVFAQEGVGVGLSFGPAFTSSKTEVDGVSNDDSKASGGGYRIAINVTYGLTENVGIYSGLGVVGKNFKNDVFDTKSKNTYLEIPIGLRLRTAELSSGLYAGAVIAPTIDINLSANIEDSNGNSVDNKDAVKTFGSSMKFGLFAEKEFDFGRVFFMPAYNLGLTNTFAGETPGFDTNTRIGYFEISLGYFF